MFGMHTFYTVTATTMCYKKNGWLELRMDDCLARYRETKRLPFFERYAFLPDPVTFPDHSQQKTPAV